MKFKKIITDIYTWLWIGIVIGIVVGFILTGVITFISEEWYKTHYFGYTIVALLSVAFGMFMDDGRIK